MPDHPAVETRMIPSDPSLFKEIRDWLAGVARKEGFDERETLELSVAVNEACANIHRHAYSGRDDGEIRFQLEIREAMFNIRIRDYGKRFLPEACRAPDFENPSEGGYGVFLIHELMDEVEYIKKDSGTELRMTKCRHAGSSVERGHGHVGQS